MSVPKLTNGEWLALLDAANEVDAGSYDGWDAGAVRRLSSAIDKIRTALSGRVKAPLTHVGDPSRADAIRDPRD